MVSIIQTFPCHCFNLSQVSILIQTNPKTKRGEKSADLGDILDLGELEGHAKASKEDGDERAGGGELRELEVSWPWLDRPRQLLEGIRHHRERGPFLPPPQRWLLPVQLLLLLLLQCDHVSVVILCIVPVSKGSGVHLALLCSAILAWLVGLVRKKEKEKKDEESCGWYGRREGFVGQWEFLLLGEGERENPWIVCEEVLQMRYACGLEKTICIVRIVSIKWMVWKL